MAFDENEQVTGFFSGGSNLLDCSNQPKVTQCNDLANNLIKYKFAL